MKLIDQKNLTGNIISENEKIKLIIKSFHGRNSRIRRFEEQCFYNIRIYPK